MAVIVTRADKGSELTHAEMDANFVNLNAGHQPIDADLTAIAALASGADKLAYATGAQTWALTDLTAAGRALIDDADASTQRTTLGLTIGTHVQAYDADLTTWAGVTPGANVATALAVAIGSNGAPVVLGGALGTPSSGTLTSVSGLPAAGVVGTAAVLGANAFTGQQTFVEVKDTVYTITDGAAFELDPVNGSIQVVTLGAARSPLATNFEAGQAILLGVDDGTAYAITWPSVTWVISGGTGVAPTLATSGFTWVMLFKQGSTLFGTIVGSP